MARTKCPAYIFIIITTIALAVTFFHSSNIAEASDGTKNQQLKLGFEFHSSSQTTILHPNEHEHAFWYIKKPISTSSTVDLHSWRTIAAIVCGAAAATISSAGGLGGGGLYVPIFNLLLGFDTKTSAALSNCMILGGVIISTVWYAFQKHGDGHRPLIDYQIALIFLPNFLLGISAGVIFNVVSPEWLVTAVLFVVLAYMTFRSCRNAVKRWDLESITRMESAVHESISAHDDSGAVSSEVVIEDGNGNLPSETDLGTPLIQNVEEYPQFPLGHLTLLGFIWVSFLGLQIVRGSEDQNLFGIETCGVIYWVLTLFQVPLAIALSGFVIFYPLKRSSITSKNKFAVEEDGHLVTSKSICFLPLVALVAGVLGGMLGLGGGMIISPVFIEMGMHPQATAATCSFMIVLASSLSVVQFWLLGRIPGEYAIFSTILALVFSFIGLQVVQAIIVKYGRVSLIVFAVSIVMGASAVLMLVFGSWDVWIQIKEDAYMGFQMPC